MSDHGSWISQYKNVTRRLGSMWDLPNNTYNLAMSEEYAFGSCMAKTAFYHFGGGPSNNAKDLMKLDEIFSKLYKCTGVRYDDLSSDCFKN